MATVGRVETGRGKVYILAEFIGLLSDSLAAAAG